MRFVLLYFMFVNLVTFVLMHKDKKNAKRRRKRRVRERTLLSLTVIGGALGTWIGMSVFRHKTKQPSFGWLAPLCTVVWAIILLWLVYTGLLHP